MCYEKLYYSFISIVILFLCLSCKKEIVSGNKMIIPMEATIDKNQYEILRLSDYAKSLEYIPLETMSESLFSDAFSFLRGNIYYNKDIFIFPFRGKILKFNRSGEFLGEIGKSGEGPEDYYAIWSIDVDEKNDCVYLMNQARSIDRYTINGINKGRIPLNKDSLHDHFQWRFQAVNENLYVFDLAFRGTPKYMIALYDSTSNLLKLVEDTQPEIKDGGYGGYSTADMYHFDGKVRFYKSITDTIYSIDSSKLVKPEFAFNFGRYKYPMDQEKQPRDVGAAPFIRLNYLLESTQYLFMDFQFGSLTPEPYVKNRMVGMGITTEQPVTMCNVMVLFNKSTGVVNLLKQPQKGDLGFLNDLEEGGPAFWPTFMSRDGTEMVMLYEAEDFIEKYSKVKNPSPQLKKVLQNLKFDNNPVAIIAKLE